ncbi:MAG: potassium transporter Kup [Methylococcales bacterium]
MTDSTLKAPEPGAARLLPASLAVLGVVYGDIGTSPIYALRACFFGAEPIELSPSNVMGVLSLITWALIFVVTIKYIVCLMRADNQGEGGILALMSLINPGSGSQSSRRYRLTVLLGIIGAALLVGDGMITPAISVLSAVEGLEMAWPSLAGMVIPTTLIILSGLFVLQSRGTGRIGTYFGPIILLWFTLLGVLGIIAIARNPAVLEALSPHFGVLFLLHNREQGFIILGAVFLAITGAEVLYADMGHFGRWPIRATWFAVVLPALLLNYFGQGAVLLQSERTVTHPFFQLAPEWLIVPLVLISTAATVIASQAVITGVFSLSYQAIRLGLCPRMTIRQTSAAHIGQIYVPAMNLLLLAGTLLIVLQFGSSDRLASAYGLAVSGAMVITTVLFCEVARQRFRINRPLLWLLLAPFLAVDLAFFGSNLLKIAEGGWLPLLIGGTIVLLLSTWNQGREILRERQGLENQLPDRDFFARLISERPARVKGTAVFFTAYRDRVPMIMLHHLQHNQVLHHQIVWLTVVTVRQPRVTLAERVDVRKLGLGFFQASINYGYMETPNIPQALAMCSTNGLETDLDQTTFYIGRQTVIASDNRVGMWYWRERLFAFLYRNALPATAFYQIPPENVVELGIQTVL